MIKLIGIDLDNTLLNHKKEISTENLNEIKRAQEAGITIMIATGREYEMVKTLLDRYQLSCPVLVLNGAECYSTTGKLMKVTAMEVNQAKSVSGALRQLNIVSRIYSNKGVHTLENKEQAFQEMMFRMYTFFPNITVEKAKELASKEPNFLNLNYVTNEKEYFKDLQVKKFVSFHQDIGLLKKGEVLLTNIPDIAVTSSFVDNIEITHKDATKGSALLFAANEFGYTKDEVMVIGDSLNDASMFEVFPQSVVMENGMEQIKQMAKYQTKTNDKDGVAFAIRQVLQAIWGN